MMKTTLPRYWFALTLFATAVACTKLDLGGSGPVPTPTSSSTASPTPSVCGTPAAGSNLVVVAMGNNIGAVTVAKYGIINGYTVLQNGSFSNKATLIDEWLNQGVLSPITSNNILQFTNVDTGGAQHSAVGFKGNVFPPIPYTFPSAAASPVATAVSTSTLWSTGARGRADVSAMLFASLHADGRNVLLWRSGLL